MALFLLNYENHALELNLESRFAEKSVFYKKISKGSFALASASLVTPKDIYDALDIEDGEFGHLVVVRFDSYWGFHDADLWLWMQGHGGSI